MGKLKTQDNIVDLSQYVTQAKYAELHNYKLGTVSQWIKRAKAGQSIPHDIDYIDIPELNITLIRQ